MADTTTRRLHVIWTLQAVWRFQSVRRREPTADVDVPAPHRAAGPTEQPEQPSDRSSDAHQTAVLVMVIALGVLWFSELVDQISGNRLDNYGIHARELDGLPEIYSAPLLHGGWDHLIANSGPFFVLGLLVLLGGAVRWVVATLVSVTVSGLTAWLLTPVNTDHPGCQRPDLRLAHLLARPRPPHPPTRAGDHRNRRPGHLRRNDLGCPPWCRRDLLAGSSGRCDRWNPRGLAAAPSARSRRPASQTTLYARRR